MYDILILALLWAYSLKAAWTGGLIKGYLSSEGQALNTARFWWSVVFWPVTLWVGTRNQ